MIRNLDNSECNHILSTNYIGYLSYIYRERPFIAPITYFFDRKNDYIIGYSGEGHKITALRKQPQVSLCITQIDSINNWKSVLAHGIFKELSGSEAKSYLHQFSLGVKDLIMIKEKRSLDFISQFSSKISKDDLPIVFLIAIEEISGKLRMS